ncbi:alpha/beta hydrolase [Mycolicibacterium moriokaense]|nr:alpha/beta hydrolase [Mycolicibacterium moriokaense]
MSGPNTGRTIIMLDQAPATGDCYEAVRERLHVAMFQTIVISVHESLTPKALVAILDRLKVPAGLLVGDGAAAEVAWSLAAAYGARFTGLVVIDSGHPSVAGLDGEIRDAGCPAVDVDTTALFSDKVGQTLGQASRRLVRGEFRLVELAGPRSSRHFTVQLAAEIVVRALSR